VFPIVLMVFCIIRRCVVTLITQTELAARSISGDHGLEAALPVEELGVEGQELGMSGISSSNDAQEQPKRRKLEYTTEQLTATGAFFYQGTIPLITQCSHFSNCISKCWSYSKARFRL
jgi:hypothetical protein